MEDCVAREASANCAEIPPKNFEPKNCAEKLRGAPSEYCIDFFSSAPRSAGVLLSLSISFRHHAGPPPSANAAIPIGPATCMSASSMSPSPSASIKNFGSSWKVLPNCS